MCHSWGRREMYTRLWCGSVKEKDYLEDLMYRWDDHIKMGL